MSTDQKEELQLSIVTIDFTPATVTFNADQISAVLDAQLAKYKGLTFTEADEATAKKVIAELRKGKTLLETYRKDTKAKLTKSVTEFEAQIKSLAEKFDAVIVPLTEQTNQFEADRRAKKRKEIEDIVTGLLIEYDLRQQFAAQLSFPDEYLNRSTSMKTIGLELRAKADQLKRDQDHHDSELQLIQSSVEMANQTLTGAGLLESTYTRLLGSLTLQQVLNRITEDAAQIREREAKAAAEAAAAAAAPPTPKPDPVDVKPASAVPEIGAITPPVVPAPADTSGRYVERYEVTGTEDQLARLESYLEQYGYEWHIIED